MARSWIYGLGASLAGVVAIVALLTIAAKDDPASAQPILLERADDRGPMPFFTGQAITVHTAPTQLSVDFGDGVTVVGGTEPGLYGGSGEQVCDRQLLIDFLESEPDKAQAWADVADIEVNEIAGYISELTPVVLLVDTLVTNHGYNEATATATPRLSILQKGTAVLVDDQGVPRVKCICGNPLDVAPASSFTPDSDFDGEPWDDFQTDRIVVVEPGERVDDFLLVDLDAEGEDAGKARIRRPTGTDGTQDIDLAPPDFTHRAQQIEVSLPDSVALTDGSIPISPRSTSGIPITLSASGACRTDEEQLTIILQDVGTCEITMVAPGNDEWAPAEITESVTVGAQIQELSFPSLGEFAAGDPPVRLAAFASSGNGVRYTVTGPCTIDGTELTAGQPGTCEVTAHQDGGNGWQPADPVTQIIDVLPPRTQPRQQQRITFESPENLTYGDAPAEITARSSSGLPVAISVLGPCSVTSSTMTITGTGECVVTVSQPGNSSFEPARSVSRTTQIAKADQTISVGSIPSQAVRGDSDVLIELGGQSSAGLPVRFEANGPCRLVSASILALTADGVCTVTAAQAGDSNHNAAPEVALSIIIEQTNNPEVDEITFNVVPDLRCTAGYDGGDGACGPAVSPTATSRSGLPPVFTVLGNCRAVGTSQVQPIAPGLCTVIASTSGNGEWLPAPAKRLDATISQLSQEVTIVPATTQAIVGDTVVITVTTSSNLTADLQASGACEIANGVARMTSAGTCVVSAAQSGSALYRAASAQQATITVTKLAQFITGGFPEALRIGDAWHVDTDVPSSSGLTVTATASGACSASPSGSVVTARTAGTCTVTLSQPGDAMYDPAPSQTGSFEVLRKEQQITASVPGVMEYQSSANIGASSTSGLPLTFTASGGGEYGCFVEQGEGVTLYSGDVGICTVIVSQEGNAEWAPTSVAIDVQVILPNFDVTVSVTFADRGSVTVNGQSCFGSCSLTLPYDTEVTVTASADALSYIRVFSGSWCSLGESLGFQTCTFPLWDNEHVSIEFNSLEF